MKCYLFFAIGYAIGIFVEHCIMRIDKDITPVVTKIEQRGYYIGDYRWIQAQKGMFNVGDTIYFTNVKPE